MNRAARRVALATVLLGVGCVPKIVRLHDAGEHQAVVSEAAKRKRAPKGKAARALAASLVVLGDREQARSVLTYDFRHGGSVESLLALADMELEQGSDGLAAAHYVRAVELEKTVVSKRPNAVAICDLFRRRARAFVSVGEAMAADADMRRVYELCGVSSDASVAANDADLRAAIEPQAEALVRARQAFEPCADDCSGGTPAERGATLEAALAEARRAGPRALAQAALERGASLDPTDLATILTAELQGRLYETTILSSAQLAVLVGYAPASRLVGALNSMRGAEAAYATLRLVPYLGLESKGDEQAKRDEAMLAGLTILSRTDHDALGWRFSAAVGDREGMDLAVSTHLRSVGRPQAGVDANGEPAGEGVSASDPTISGVARPEGLAGRVFVDRTNLPLLVVYARLREVRNPRLALEIERYALAEAKAAQIGGAADMAEQAVERRLAMGQPWQALAVARVSEVSSKQLGRVGTVLADASALCDGTSQGCASLRADRELAELVAGPLKAPASGRLARTLEADGCPGLHQLVESSALGSALEMAAADLGARETGQALGAAVESDLTLACVGSVVAPLLDGGAHDLVARTLADRFGLVPDPRASQTELTLFRLALAGDRPEQAEVRLRNAAGLAPEPEDVWLAAASRDATRELRLEALRELLLLRPGHPDAEDWYRQLVVIALQDANDDPNTRRYDHARASLVALVDDYLARQPSARQPALRRSLLDTLAQLDWADPQAREIVVEAVAGPMPERHAVLLDRLAGKDKDEDKDERAASDAGVAQALLPAPPKTPAGVAYRLLDADSSVDVAQALALVLPDGASLRLKTLIVWLAAARLPFLDDEPEVVIRLAFDLPLPVLPVEFRPAP